MFDLSYEDKSKQIKWSKGLFVAEGDMQEGIQWIEMPGGRRMRKGWVRSRIKGRQGSNEGRW